MLCLFIQFITPYRVSASVNPINSLDSYTYQNINNFINNFVDKRLKIYINKDTDLESFKKLYNKDLLNISELSNIKLKEINDKSKNTEIIQTRFAQRLRNSKNVIGREYYKNDTKINISNINLIDTGIYEVNAYEVTKLYYKTPSNESDYEIYGDNHIFTLKQVNNSFVVLNDDMPNSLINSYSSNDTLNLSVSKPETIKPTNKNNIQLPTLTSGASYDRSNAVSYADSYYITGSNSSNYRTFSPSDCTNFLSQCIKAGFWSLQDTSGSRQWFYTTGYVLGVGYSSSWGVAQDSYNYWYLGQQDTTRYEQYITSQPNDYSTVPSGIMSKALGGNAVYYHTDPSASVYYNHAAVCVGTKYLSTGMYRPIVDSHTNDRYHADYTLYPYTDYNSMISIGYNPSITIVNIPDWSPLD